MTSILIVDDHELIRDGMRLILETNSRYSVVNEVSNGQEALHFLKEHMPDIILLDLNMPILDGMSFLKAIQPLTKADDISVIILTTYNEEHLVQEALTLGAKGFLLKDTGRKNLFSTIDAALAGKVIREQQEEVQRTAIHLTKKEIYIMDAIAHGQRSKDIASHLNIAERTLKSYLTKIYNKLGVNSRAEAVAVALRENYIELK